MGCLRFLEHSADVSAGRDPVVVVLQYINTFMSLVRQTGRLSGRWPELSSWGWSVQVCVQAETLDMLED